MARVKRTSMNVNMDMDITVAGRADETQLLHCGPGDLGHTLLVFDNSTSTINLDIPIAYESFLVQVEACERENMEY